VGWEKVACWSTKAAISLIRVKIRGKVTMESLWEVTNVLSNDTIPDHLRPPLPQDWGTQPTPKLQLPLSQERLKQIWPDTFTGSMQTQAHEKFWRKGSVGVSRDGPNFFSTPYYLRNGQSYELQIWDTYSHGPCKQKPLRNWGENRAWAYPGTAQIL